MNNYLTDNEKTSGKRSIYIDPSYKVYNSDGLFKLDDPVLNRDDQLFPYYRLREKLASKNQKVHTADYLNHVNHDSILCEYYSLGILADFKKIKTEKNANLSAFVIMEPPIVAPHLYAALPELTVVFDRVYVHNVDGDGYSLTGVMQEKLRKFYWAIPYDNILEPYWNKRDRSKRIVVINGSHNPHSRAREQYSTRLEAMVALSKFGVVDLYGRGWTRWWSRAALWLPYWRNRSTLMSIYKGTCASKFEVLQQYEFCLCFENMAMNGYITEKIFDCIYAGTIPLYLGAPDILKYIPSTVYVDCTKFASWSEMWQYVSTMPRAQIQEMKEAGRSFLGSEKAKPFFDSIDNIVGDGL